MQWRQRSKKVVPLVGQAVPNPRIVECNVPFQQVERRVLVEELHRLPHHRADAGKEGLEFHVRIQHEERGR